MYLHSTVVILYLLITIFSSWTGSLSFFVFIFCLGLYCHSSHEKSKIGTAFQIHLLHQKGKLTDWSLKQMFDGGINYSWKQKDGLPHFPIPNKQTKKQLHVCEIEKQQNSSSSEVKETRKLDLVCSWVSSQLYGAYFLLWIGFIWNIDWQSTLGHRLWEEATTEVLKSHTWLKSHTAGHASPSFSIF